MTKAQTTARREETTPVAPRRDGNGAHGAHEDPKRETRGGSAAGRRFRPEDYLDHPIAIIGSGGFGTTLAVLLAKKGYEVNQWVRNEKQSWIMREKRENQKYLPGVTLPLNIYISQSLPATVERARIAVIAVPSQAVREAAETLLPCITDPDSIIVNVAKGIEHDTYLRMSEVIADVVGDQNPIVTLSGPNHAEEIGRDMPGATVVASNRPECLPVVCEMFSTRSFKVFPHTDLVGVELGGVTKNIVALATGICDGIGYGDNTRSAIITLGLSEMIRFGRAMGAKKETYMGLAGLGDLIATCTSPHSRNRHVGEQLGRGESLDEILESMHGKVAEGVPATRFVHEYALKHGIDLPLTGQIYKVLFEGKPVTEGARDLLKLM
ncbi:MAG: NAD(P)-dependent glycerol-3-phosphate dehydrogenase [Euryarchaeota archaeon]|nr:NAD(P)-dependent glycerol-3-phosphate dehydrogenase [Euryarchaeota archaeon]